MTQQTQQYGVVPAEQIKGMDIMNPEGEDLGKIDEFFIDLEYGRLSYAAVSLGGGFPGMKGKLHAVPWQAFSWTPQGKRLVLNVDKQALKDSPGFDKDDYPDLGDRRWLGSVFNYFRQTPYWGIGEEGSEDAARL